MSLSVIIVNYNVKYFLEQCLYSVQAAGAGLEMEVIVVDNNSTDDSLEYLRAKFSGIRFIDNPANEGFARACNRGIRESKGQFILFLNPDTLVAEDSFRKCIGFFLHTS